jgi:hypothetical protein
MYGTMTRPWEEFAHLFMALQSCPITIRLQEDAEITQSMNNITAIARRSQNGSLHMSLFHLLLATSYNQ